MKRQNSLGIAAFLGAALLSQVASAASLAEQMIGTWELISNTENYSDGSTYKWDPDAKGQLILGVNGSFSLQIGVGARKPAEGNPALNPVGRYIGYFGSYTVNETDKTFVFRIVRASFPAWDGSEQKRVISEISDTTLTYKAEKPIPSPKGTFTPVLIWSRIK